VEETRGDTCLYGGGNPRPAAALMDETKLRFLITPWSASETAKISPFSPRFLLVFQFGLL
jgi:hypothetical protein